MNWIESDEDLHQLYPPVAASSLMSCRQCKTNDGRDAIIISLHGEDGGCIGWTVTNKDAINALVDRCLSGEDDRRTLA